MAVIFESRPGRVIAVDTPGAAPIQIQLTGWTGYTGMRAIISQIGIDVGTRHQFSHTFSDVIYAYIMGQKIGDLMLSGVAFGDACEGSANGLESIIKFYESNNIAVAGKPADIAIGSGLAMRGFITGMRLELARPEWQMSQFSIRFNHFPRRRVA